MTRQPTCGYILRAETGPCEYLGQATEPCGDPQAEGVRHRPCHDDRHKFGDWFHHPYLGPSLGVCGHAEDEHEDVMAGYPACRTCTEAGIGHGPGGYTLHPFQPAAEENSHA